MGFGGAGGITSLSELIIDAAPDKAKDIAELLLTTRGDILWRALEVERLAGDYGVGFNVLHMLNTGQLALEWKDIQDWIIYLTGAVNRMITLPTLVIPIPGVSLEVTEDHSGGGQTVAKELTIPVPSIEIATATYTPAAVDGAIADDGGAQTDETTEANSADPDDMTLLPAVPAVDDAYYFGRSILWDWLCLNIGVAGAGVWTIVWEYWNGSTWTALPTGYYDTSNGFKSAGKQSVSFVRPLDWATSTLMLMDLYWIRARVSAYTSVTTQPLGTQAWIGAH
ncbi:hypothetical protein ES703_99706 [subsurface metagenome]